MGSQQDRAKALANGVAAEPKDDVVRYMQCQRNHAVRIGLHVVDGCREFMASGREGDAALLCAACEFHRSFYRRVVGEDSDIPAPPTPPAAGDRR